MEKQTPSSPGIRQQGYELAYRLACEQLAATDVKQQCLRSGARYQDANNVIVEFLNQLHLVSLPNVEISLLRSGEEVPLKNKIIILHYLTLSKGTPATGRFITFRELPGCDSYFPVFHQLALRPLLDRFGQEPDLMVDAATQLGGRRASHGHVSVTIEAFPRVPITTVLWKGDEEFPPSCSMMFDANISDYLPTEDIRDICATITRKLVQSIPSPSRRER